MSVLIMRWNGEKLVVPKMSASGPVSAWQARYAACWGTISLRSMIYSITR